MYDSFILVTVYTPNSGSELKRLPYRQSWDKEFHTYLKALETRKPVIVCGDLNVAHQDIDLARPKPNYNKSAGYTQAEIDGIQRYLDNGFIDGSQFRYISEEEYKRVHKNWQPEENDILISRIGTLGLVAIIKKSDLPIAVHYNMLNIKASFVSYSFLYFY